MQTIVDQSYIEPYDWISRKDFHDANNCWPEDCKIATSQVTDSAGETVTGILCTSEDTPRVEVQRGKMFVRGGVRWVCFPVRVCLWWCAYGDVSLGVLIPLWVWSLGWVGVTVGGASCRSGVVVVVGDSVLLW